MEKRNIALIGFRATGKSLIGSILARKLRRVFIDMDEELVRVLGMDIQSWVRDHGWESFREAESRLLADLAERKGLVVATGGGIIQSPVNRTTLREYFTVIWLQASSGIILTRLAGDARTTSFRPALTHLPPDREVEHLLEERTPLYAEIAQLSIPTDTHTPDTVASLILTALEANPSDGSPLS